MATTNTQANPTQMQASTLEWLMRRWRQDHAAAEAAWVEATRRTVKGCKKPRTQARLLAAIDAYEQALTAPVKAQATTPMTHEVTFATYEGPGTDMVIG